MRKTIVKLAITVLLAVLMLERYLANRAARWHSVAWKPWKEPAYTVQLK